MDEKRNREEPIPSNIGEYLNQLQIATLHKIEQFGWQLWFIRRPLFQDVIAVVADTNHSSTAVLELDGSMNKNHGMVFRA